ncbi:F-box/LRR-repeat protein 3-like isoform X1 [Zingiber officinale]|uniref:F-box/LRR-repeat protein 3-like isoform X1 n=1 Tax=Zingiber officinale TaxID=94328 RepID=UPI001C4B7164|nr:F-box/LRR-repeat protein 3-like isoform X1 [Zingiber officinale]
MNRQPPCDCDMATVFPLDLLANILDRVPDPRDRKSCRLVCRGFLRAEELHRRSLRVLRLEALTGLLRRSAAGLECLDLSACPALDDRSLSAALAAGVDLLRLRSVSLSRASGVGWRGLMALVDACPHLEAVDLSHCVGVGDREAAALAAAAGLKELRLDKCLGLTDVGLATVAVGCAGLEILGIKWCLEISDIGIDLLAKKCQDLKELDISYLKITNRSINSISSLGKLEVLNMVGCSDIDDEGLQSLKHRNNSLRSINVSRCENVTSSGLTSVIEGSNCLQKLNVGDCFPCSCGSCTSQELAPLFLSKLNGLKDSLTVLKLDGFQVSASSLKIIGLNCKNLAKIGLSKCQWVTDEGICELVASCVHLTTIDLTCCRLLTDKALMAIGDQCKQLRCLRLESCSLITDKGLEYIGTCCSNLEEIDLTDCSITDTAMQNLSRCSKMLVLKLGLCYMISDEGLVHIASNCRKLHELDLYRCVEVTDDGLAAIATGCKLIQKLNLCYCTKISDRGLKQVSHLVDLRDLELRGLPHVSSSGIAKIAIGCRRLSELDLKRCNLVNDEGLFALAQYTENLRQINISYCPVSGMGLCILLGTLKCLQDVKLVHLSLVPIEWFEIALRASYEKLKKLKLLTGMRNLLSPLLIEKLQLRGCRIRWVDKPPAAC